MSADTISNKEAVEMMRRCKEEIVILRATIDRLNPKADAYDKLAIVLGLLPRASVGMGENIVWTLDKRMRELEAQPIQAEAPPVPNGHQGGET